MNINKDAITLEDAMINYDAKNTATVCDNGSVTKFEFDGYHAPVYKGVL